MLREDSSSCIYSNAHHDLLSIKGLKVAITLIFDPQSWSLTFAFSVRVNDLNVRSFSELTVAINKTVLKIYRMISVCQTTVMISGTGENGIRSVDDCGGGGTVIE